MAKDTPWQTVDETGQAAYIASMPKCKGSYLTKQTTKNIGAEPRYEVVRCAMSPYTDGGSNFIDATYQVTEWMEIPGVVYE